MRKSLKYKYVIQLKIKTIWIITVDKENIFQVIQNTFMIKKQTLGKIGQSRNFINKAKDIYKKIYECIF